MVMYSISNNKLNSKYLPLEKDEKRCEGCGCKCPCECNDCDFCSPCNK